MICHHCGCELPEGSSFCQYCGMELKETATEDSEKEIREYLEDMETVVLENNQQDNDQFQEEELDRTVRVQRSAPAYQQPPVQANVPQARCQKCGAPVPAGVKKCAACSKKSPMGAIVAIALLALLVVASAGLNVLQYFDNQDNEDSIARLQSTMSIKDGTITQKDGVIAEYEATITEHESTIASQKTTISDLNSQISGLKDKAGYYDTLCKEMTTGKVGYAADNFKANASVVVVDKNTTNKKITLTAHWSGGGTVSTDYSSSAAWVDYDADSWSTTVNLTIKPEHEGVTAVTFSNNIDSKTFKVIIIVTE